MLRFKHLG